MLRLITYLLFVVFFITILRNVVGFVMRFFTNAVRSAAARQQGSRPSAQTNVPLTGELKKDPVCGTYTAAATSLHETVAGQTFYFCSPACRDKFALQAAQRR
jgi:YHS domain-containing protein